MIKLFEEFVKISDYKKWEDFYNKKFYDEIGKFFRNFSDHDRNYNRVYFDLKVDHSRFRIWPPDELKDFLNWNRYFITDYYLGLCKDKDGKIIKIGKLLTKLGETKLLKTYNDSRKNLLKNTDDLQVVISRHPYDIIGMSTNRGWTTCHDLNDKRYGGEHLHNIRYNLERGSLIAYLIRKNDRNIKEPISRCLLKGQIIGNQIFVNVDHHVYGTNIPEFTEFLTKWTKELNSKLYKENI